MNIYDIAKKSGVSIATISRVINGGKNVSKKTYDKVLAVIEEEGYTPNVFARGLGLNTMETIGILVSDVADPYYAQMISYLTTKLHNLGLNVLLGCTGNTLENKNRELQMLLDKRVDAIFLAGSSQQELRGNQAIKSAAKKIPVIMVNGRINAPGIINVASNDQEAIYSSVFKLHNSGFSKPLYVFNTYTYSAHQKMAGFKKACSELGKQKAFLRENMLQLPNTLEEMSAAILKLIDADKEFDCVIGSEDMLAIAAQKALKERDLKMPVIGYNNSILAKVSSPTLTSIDNRLEELCSKAVKLFHETTTGSPSSTYVTLDCQLIERDSFRTENNTK